MQEEFFLKLLVRSKKNTSARNLYIHSFIFLAFFCLKPLSYIGDETEVSALLGSLCPSAMDKESQCVR